MGSLLMLQIEVGSTPADSIQYCALTSSADVTSHVLMDSPEWRSCVPSHSPLAKNRRSQHVEKPQEFQGLLQEYSLRQSSQFYSARLETVPEQLRLVH